MPIEFELNEALLKVKREAAAEVPRKGGSKGRGRSTAGCFSKNTYYTNERKYDIICANKPGWHSGDCASFVMRNYQGFESLTRLHFF